MAVAVKTSSGSRSGRPLVGPAIISLVGVLYLLGCLGIIFKLLPSLWWSLWSQLNLQGSQFVGGSLLVIVSLAVGVGLLILGSRLLGPNPPVGVRSGVFVAFGGFVVVILLARWASLWLEHWAYDSRWFSPQTGEMIAAGVALLLLVGWIRLFTRPAVQKFVLMVEHGGWFHATAYKHNQGQKVRRGTIFGILLLVLAGIYTLVTHNTLRGAADWSVNIPFSGAMAIESDGDVEPFIKRDIPLSARDRVDIRWPGRTNLKPKEIISFQAYKEAVTGILKDEKPSLLAALEKVKDEPIDYLQKVDDAIRARVKQLLTPETGMEGSKTNPPFFKEDAIRRLKEIEQRGNTTLPDLLQALEKETKSIKDYVKVRSPGAAKFPPDQVTRDAQGNLLVPRKVFDTAVAKLQEEKRKGENVDLPVTAPLTLEDLGIEFALPGGLLVVDRYAMREVNDLTNPREYVKVRFPGDAQFTPDQIIARDSQGNPIVSRETFDAVVAKLQEEKKKGKDRELPLDAPLVPAYGTVTFSSITLLPSVKFTVPLLLLALSLWLAWRIVNMPTFADFLIATEAELNKVSWTTQKRLIQDTIVVLVTVALLALFLFAMDWTWKVVLSAKPIGVLHIPKDQAETEKKIDQKRW